MQTPQILYEDDSMLVINKPAGITVNKADTTKGEMTVQEWAEQQFRIQNLEFRIEEGNDFYNRGGIVHRLDKEKAVIWLVAKTPEAFIELQRQFKERTVKKTYHALVHGLLRPEEGEIRVPVGRLPWNRKQFGIVAGGREAVTKYKVLFTRDIQVEKKKEPVSFVELYPETGRTHQIRVHLKYINHPIFADFLYAGRKTAREDRKILPRVFLHAAKISFAHPESGKTMDFEAPLPEELRNVLK